jgi:hypothetical protein
LQAPNIPVIKQIGQAVEGVGWGLATIPHPIGTAIETAPPMVTGSIQEWAYKRQSLVPLGDLPDVRIPDSKLFHWIIIQNALLYENRSCEKMLWYKPTFFKKILWRIMMRLRLLLNRNLSEELTVAERWEYEKFLSLMKKEKINTKTDLRSDFTLLRNREEAKHLES